MLECCQNPHRTFPSHSLISKECFTFGLAVFAIKDISRTSFHSSSLTRCVLPFDESFLSMSPSQSFAEQFGVCAGWCHNRPPMFADGMAKRTKLGLAFQCAECASQCLSNTNHRPCVDAYEWNISVMIQNARVSASQGQDFKTTRTC